MIDTSSSSFIYAVFVAFAVAFCSAYVMFARKKEEEKKKKVSVERKAAATSEADSTLRRGRRKANNKPLVQAPQRQRKASNNKSKVSAFNHPLLVHLINAHKNEVTAAAISDPVNGANFVASSSDDYTLKVWSVCGGKASPFRHVKIAGDWASAMTFTADGKGLVLAMQGSRDIVFYEIAHHKEGVSMLPSVFEKYRFPSSHPIPVQSLAISRANTVMTAGCNDDLSICLWSPKGSLLQSITTNQITNQMACMSPDGAFFAAATRMGDTKIWTISQKGDFSLKVAMVLKGHPRGLHSISMSGPKEDGGGAAFAATACMDGKIRLWNLDVRWSQNEDPKIVFEQAVEGCSQVSLSPTHPHPFRSSPSSSSDLMVVVKGTVLRLYRLNVASGKAPAISPVFLEEIETGHSGGIRCFQRTGDGKMLLTTGKDTSVRIWRLEL